MRALLRYIACLLAATPLLAGAQVPLDYTAIDNARQLSFSPYQAPITSKVLGKNWRLNTFAGLSGSYGFFNRGNMSMISAPVTMELTHQLNKNLYAFGAVSAAPAYANFNNMFLRPADKVSPAGMMTGLNQFGWYSRAEAGLFYINDEKTFSISGSIYTERSSYPTYLPYAPQRTPNRAW